MTTPTQPVPRRDGIGFLVTALRNRPRARLALSILSILLLVGGIALLAYPFATNLYQDRLQQRLDRQLASPTLRQAYKERRVQTGDSLTRIKIPAIGVDTVVVEGTSASALRAGAGHYPNTPLPCETGNVAIAGHRTTYGKPFANVDQLKPGDTIELDTPIGGCVYRIAAKGVTVPNTGMPFVVDKSDLRVIDATPGKVLTLTSCHPKGSASHRIIIQAVWEKDLPPIT
ncbi:MAG: Membrane protein [Acidimicrobiales bacterium]|jgi:sortase A|nr:Membrane protein [Acidimicrobiales bacterium]